MPRPGSHGYDIKRAHLRKRLENTGAAADEEADREANRRLQRDPKYAPERQSERGRGPKGER
ncbi:hypothetical protein [Bailinhaonella thermotolerans]|uniref:Phosphatidylethanolamine-binding protein n=1 Tax=Bailinhaonella thermotolerans TaxID=1070861 RepID=A0A3A4A9L1_9ACTN|nr:hypothetical protein [Bailinhaonella thermotolerans]RJL22730.1 hypothetical protein D5H75_34625 [Bailinhaonella thermotolerans]